ncbi:sensor histidine kinase [Clostridium formicaceticum]|nr:sensor histidine kinase [Clostridium formicaceticum]
MKKHRQKNKFIPYTLLTILFLFIFTAISVGSYAPMKANFIPSENDAKAYIESNNFAYTLGRLTRYLYQPKVENTTWHDPRYENVESVRYSMTNDNNSINISNTSDAEYNALQQEIKDSLFYLQVKFDENGHLEEIESSLGERFDKDAFINGFIFTDEDRITYANLEAAYIIPKDFVTYHDLFTYSMKEFTLHPNHILLILAIGAASILLLVILTFSIPYAIQKQTVICSVFNSLFLEFKMALWLAFALPSVVGIGVTGRYSTIYNPQGFNIVEAIYDANGYFYLIGIPVTFILYLFIYLTIVYIKYVYYTGFKEGFIKNSIIGKLSFHMMKNLKKTFKKVMTIDITKDPHKKIFIILVTNLFILWLIALGGGFAFILAIAYSIFLFKYFLGLMDTMKDIHAASSQLAEGGFDISLEEDIGMLSPIAKNLNNIKQGFQLAVDKEIKSQRMKAELISNVSHDLKTPLTSIITYIDLLKKKDLNIETRDEYIGILDKKSKRLKVLIEDLFEASKATSGNIELHFEKIDIIALFRQTLGELEEKIKNSSLQIKTNLPEHKVICELDGKRTYRVFENVMSNIFKYAMENSRVYVDVIENQAEVSFIFKNISAYEMNFDAKEITERFVRGDASRSTEGSGLGLSIAKSFVEIQKGDLSINIDGDLFKLTVTFPKAELLEILDK